MTTARRIISGRDALEPKRDVPGATARFTEAKIRAFQAISPEGQAAILAQIAAPDATQKDAAPAVSEPGLSVAR